MLFLVLIPRNVGVLIIRGYRATISRLYGDVCRYYPSCSAYGLGAVQQRGLVVGASLTAWRILRCNPWSAGGVDEVRAAKHDRYRVTGFGWVVPAGFRHTDVPAATVAVDAHDHSTHGHGAGQSPSQPLDTSHDSHRTAVLTLSSPTESRKD
jgi:putative membrane protein insertion efficiency factor